MRRAEWLVPVVALLMAIGGCSGSTVGGDDGGEGGGVGGGGGSGVGGGGIGGSGGLDSDGDGVPDELDQCPGYNDALCDHVVCNAGVCECASGWTGTGCTTCDVGFFGADCAPCSCGSGDCDDGLTGSGVCTACDDGYFGPTCAPCTCDHGTCDDGPEGAGTCEGCELGWAGLNCDVCGNGWAEPDCLDCEPDRYGPACMLCACLNGTCNSGTSGDGHCSACDLGWQGTDCDSCAGGFSGAACDDCAAGFFGVDCAPCTCVNGTCDDGRAGAGDCLSCTGGWSGPDCDLCGAGYFGADCAPCTCLNGTCREGEWGDGHCSSCDPNWTGLDCELADLDDDGIPDVEDPFPGDATQPVPGLPNMVYAETSTHLYTMDPVSYVINEIGAFSIAGSGAALSQVTDLAIDRYLTLYAVSFSDLYTCDPLTAVCTPLTTLPESFNAMTLVPAGTVHADRDALVVISQAGNWSWVEIQAGAATLHAMGAYGAGYTSSGDAFSIVGVGTFAAVNKSGVSSDVILAVEPTTGASVAEIATLDDGSSSYTSVYGIAGWHGQVFAFDASGDVLAIDPFTGTWSVAASTGHAWWGAGISTVLF